MTTLTVGRSLIGQSEPMGYGIAENTWPAIEHLFQRSIGITESSAKARGDHVIVVRNPQDVSPDVYVFEMKVQPHPEIESWGGALGNTPDWPATIISMGGTEGRHFSTSKTVLFLRAAGDIGTFDARDTRRATFNTRDRMPAPSRSLPFMSEEALGAAYAEMASDEEYEREALEWIDGLVGETLE